MPCVEGGAVWPLGGGGRMARILSARLAARGECVLIDFAFEGEEHAHAGAVYGDGAGGDEFPAAFAQDVQEGIDGVWAVFFAGPHGGRVEDDGFIFKFFHAFTSFQETL